MRATSLVAGAGAAAILMGFGVAAATPPGKNGRVGFRRYTDARRSAGAVFTMNADGTDVRQVTHPPQGTVDDQPDWSQDGRRLVFCRTTRGGCAITVVNADGSGLRRVSRACVALPPKCVDRYNVSFVPDGRRVVFTRATGRVGRFDHIPQIEHSAVAVMALDGSGEREIYRLPRYAGDVDFPQMSPDGTHVVFERVNGPRSKRKFSRAIFVVGTDGKGLRQLTPWSLAAGDGADWSPDGSRILFRSKEDVDERHSQYFTVKPDGTALTQLTRFPVGTKIFSATWSPDGTQIVFAKGDAQKRGDVWVMNADGTNQHAILTAPAWDSAADWGPSL